MSDKLQSGKLNEDTSSRKALYVGWVIIAVMPLVALMYITLFSALIALAIAAVKLVFNGI